MLFRSNGNIEACGNRLIKLDELYNKFLDLEEKNLGIQESYEALKELGIECQDWAAKSQEAKDLLLEIADKLDFEKDALETANQELAKSSELFKEFCARYEKEVESLTGVQSAKQKFISDSTQHITDLRNEFTKLNNKAQGVAKIISNNKILLMELIVCPKCSHKFNPNNSEISPEVIKATEEAIKSYEQESLKVKKMIPEIERQIKTAQQQNEKANQELSESKNKSSQLTRQRESLALSLEKSEAKVKARGYNIDALTAQADSLTQKIKGIRADMFDEVFDIIDTQTVGSEREIKAQKSNIDFLTGSIRTLETSIVELESAETDMAVNSLKEKLDKTKAKYDDLIKNKLQPLEDEADLLKAQHDQFLEYKTHLANSKIQALSDFTNEFLDKIGSDIRIRFEGFTKLKSGKIRDKISVTLLRDGLDCGSFAKFSEGEKARINLASILAQHELTNANCADGKGFDLLILDEILEATDECGLANIFEALNKLKLTTLVVSHGNISESYPYFTRVEKSNGVSHIK